jgi:hypothetical protein
MKSMPKRAFSEATMVSKGSTMVMPIPTAAPLTAATSGFERRASATQSRPLGSPPEPSAVFSPGSTPSMRLWKVSSMSAPAQKPRPAPVMTTAPMAGSAFAVSKASACSTLICGVHAFSFSGRFRVITATSPRVS